MIMNSVLIVEDEIFVALDIERILVDAGFQVAAIAADQHDALAVADTDRTAIAQQLRTERR